MENFQNMEVHSYNICKTAIFQGGVHIYAVGIKPIVTQVTVDEKTVPMALCKYHKERWIIGYGFVSMSLTGILYSEHIYRVG